MAHFKDKILYLIRKTGPKVSI